MMRMFGFLRRADPEAAQVLGPVATETAAIPAHRRNLRLLSMLYSDFVLLIALKV